MNVPKVDLRNSGVSWGKATLFRRASWSVIWTFCRFMPKRRLGRKARIFLLKLFGARVGEKVWVFPSVQVTDPKNLEIKTRAVVGPSVEIYNYAEVFIGEHTVISQRCYLCTASHDYTKCNFPMYWKPIRIERDVWLAEGVMVMPGVTIGRGCVIGARSVVTKDMPPWMVCAGNPCKPLKRRNLSNT